MCVCAYVYMYVCVCVCLRVNIYIATLRSNTEKGRSGSRLHDPMFFPEINSHI